MRSGCARQRSASSGHLIQWFRAVASRGLPDELAEYVIRERYAAHPDSAHGRALAGEPLVHIAGISGEVLYRSGADPTRRAFVDLGGARTLLAMPLRSDKGVLGILTLYRRGVRLFADKHIVLLQSFVAQAVIAIENARLLDELRQSTDDVAGLNRNLEARVAAQLAELERTGKLRRFLAPQLADMIVAHGNESILESHRREIVVVFCDIRGFTDFAERAEPEVVMALLRDYHAALAPIVIRYEVRSISTAETG